MVRDIYGELTMTAFQKPIDSPFGATSTADDVIRGIDLKGKTVLVTGGYSGLGLDAVRVLHGAGAKIIVPARDLAKARNNLALFPDITIDVMDLMDPASVNNFAERFLAANTQLDILINCAGVMAAPLSRDSRGNESQFSTNVLGHFQLTCRLWPALIAATGARVVALSSANHHVETTELLHDPNFRHREYDPWKAYAQSKAACALFAVALDSIGKRHGVRAFSVHPGGIYETGLLRHTPDSLPASFGMIDGEGKPVIDPEKTGFKTVRQGSSTIVWAATSPLLEGKGGVYCADNNIGSLLREGDERTLTGVSLNATDPVNAGRLWHLSEELTGSRLD